MPIEIVTVPCLSDNYAYLIKGADGVWLVDAPEAEPIIAALDARGWTLDTLLITHHHHDHVGGVEALRNRYGCTVMGPEAEAAKLPPLDRALADGDKIGSGDMTCTVIAVPGHTLGHIAFHMPAAKAVFTADSLMALGCGRVFEGTMDMMWATLSRLAALPPETMVYSGHEYTAANARFALSIDGTNSALISRSNAVTARRQKNEPTVPVSLAEELATNPFLRASDPTIRAQLGLPSAPDAAVFAELRQRKDRF